VLVCVRCLQRFVLTKKLRLVSICIVRVVHREREPRAICAPFTVQTVRLDGARTVALVHLLQCQRQNLASQMNICAQYWTTSGRFAPGEAPHDADADLPAGPRPGVRVLQTLFRYRLVEYMMGKKGAG
jgi:hypothetical protein